METRPPKPTAKFALIVRELVEQFGGTVFELSGDEALCLFSSPRQCLRLGVALQQRFVEETVGDASLPMTVGIGVDAGEAVRGPDGYRGGALNLAARLCSQAKAGEVLASPEVAHMASTIDGIRYAALDRVALKGLSEPIRPFRVFPEGEDPARQMAALISTFAPAPPPAVRWLPRPLVSHPRLTVIWAALISLVVAATPVVALRHDGGGAGLTALRENSLAVLDPSNAKLIKQVDIEAGPTAVAAGFDSIWITNTDGSTVTRIDAASLHVTDTITVGAAPSAIARGPDSMWVTNSGDGTVSRIDPTTGDARTIQVGVAPSGVVVAHGSVWVTNAADGTVSRIDPVANVEVQHISVGSGPSGIAAGRDIWVANSASDTVTQIDGSRHVVIDPAIRVGSNPRNVAVVGDGVWVSYNGGDAVARISTADASVANPVQVGQHPDQVTAVDGHVWTTLQGSGAIVEVDPTSGRAVRTVPVGPIPGGITAAAGKLWVTTTSDPTLHRGGTLHLVGPSQGIDPMFGTGLDDISLLASSYDGLVGFRHASGAGGLTLVPDLATAIPVPTDSGRTYTFRLRDGIHWSTGTAVTVDDVKRGIERAAAASSGLSLRQLLAGSGSCSPHRCDISGITVDNTARTVTLRIVRPSGNLFDLLAFAVAVPPGQPLAETTSPIPATGPYKIETDHPGKLMVLARNRFFREWSAAAQPAGFPDRIEYRMLPPKTANDAIAKVAAATADWADAGDAYDRLDAHALDLLRTRFASRLHLTPTQTMFGVFLNTRVAPFDNVNVRKALAYAIDRRAVAGDWDSPATPTCQFLPPDYPGYRPFCPYTLRSDAAVWHGSDVEKALQLVKGLHPERTTVTVWTWPNKKLGIQPVVDALQVLGYKVRFKIWPANTVNYFTYVLDGRHRVQMGFMGWLTYDASAANLFSSYRCDAIPSGGDPAQFCDPALDRLMDRAEAIQATSLAAANDLWAEVERRLLDAAPWVPLVNPLSVDVLSTRVHNFKRTPALGVLFDQMWVE